MVCRRARRKTGEKGIPGKGQPKQRSHVHKELQAVRRSRWRVEKKVREAGRSSIMAGLESH